MTTYTKRLKDLRTDNQLTQEEIAKILKCTQTAYGKWENGQRDITIDKLIILAKYYKVSLDYIAGLTQDPRTNWVKKCDILPPIVNNKVTIKNNKIKGNITVSQN